MTDITIPPEALQEAWERYLLDGCGPYAFEAACRAMLKAWPGMEMETVFVEENYLILPLPQENNNGAD
jgi:hypothetical protein